MLKRLKALLMWDDRSPKGRQHRLFCLVCALAIVVCIVYVVYYFADQDRVRREGASYRALYSPAAAGNGVCGCRPFPHANGHTFPNGNPRRNRCLHALSERRAHANAHAAAARGG